MCCNSTEDGTEHPSVPIKKFQHVWVNLNDVKVPAVVLEIDAEKWQNRKMFVCDMLLFEVALKRVIPESWLSDATNDPAWTPRWPEIENYEEAIA